MKKGETNFKKRLNLIKFGIFVCLSIVFLKICHIQLIDHKAMDYQGYKKNPVILHGERGEIRDANGIKLAVSEMRPSIIADPKKITNKVAYAKILSEVLEMPEEEVYKKINTNKRFVYIKRLATPKQGKEVLKKNLKYIFITQEPIRIYPENTLAGQVIGHLQLYSDHGQAGLEYKYDDELRGEEKKISVYMDARNKEIKVNTEETKVRRKGNNVILTLRSNYQLILEKEIQKQVEASKAIKGFGIIMNPKTGEIYAMASYPFFDPNKFRNYSAEEKRNLPIANNFEPGSVMKSLLVAIAFNENKIKEGDVFNVEGGTRQIGGRIIRDVSPKNELDIAGILRFSSNIGASKIMERIPKSTYHKKLKDLGFGEKTQIDLPGEESGILVQPEKWSKIQRANIAFGQGISVTSIQLAQAISVIANGGELVVPYIVKSIETPDGTIKMLRQPKIIKRVLKYETAKKMRRILRRSLEESTPRALIQGINVSGKTGTAQKPTKGGYSKIESKHIVSMIGFAPSEDPMLVSVITIDEPKRQGPSLGPWGGIWAAPIFKETIEKILTNVEGVEKLAMSNEVPSFIGRGKREAIMIANNKNVKIKIYGSGFVQKQNPLPGKEYKFNEEIVLFLEPGF